MLDLLITFRCGLTLVCKLLDKLLVQWTGQTHEFSQRSSYTQLLLSGYVHLLRSFAFKVWVNDHNKFFVQAVGVPLNFGKQLNMLFAVVSVDS